MNWIYIAVLLLFIINIAGFITVGMDKHRAKHRKWRIPEKHLFLLGLVGGCPGVYLGFLTFRHKTKHLRFMLGIPVIFILQVLLLYYTGNYLDLNFIE